MKILLAVNDEELLRSLVAVLLHNGYQVDTVRNGKAAIDKACKNIYDTMVIDIILPIVDGIETVKIIRNKGKSTPIILLSESSGVSDRIMGLDIGADDYLIKPFSMGELLASIRARIRRSRVYNREDLEFASLRLDLSEQEIKARNTIRISGKECRLMELLMRNTDHEISTADIYHAIWDKDKSEYTKDVVWVYISYLKQKLEAIGADAEIIGNEGESFILRKTRRKE